MCGRYRLTAKERYLRDHFGIDGDLSWEPRWNIAPTQPIPVIRQDAKEPRRTFSLLRWGLIPYWAKDSSIGFKTINGMSETAAEKPAFRDAMRQRRCLIPADGFYEWQKLGGKEKQPYSFGMIDDAVGRARRQLAEWTGDTEEQLKGAAQQVKGKSEEAIGKIRDVVREKTHRKNRDTEDQHEPIDDVQRPQDPTRANR